MAERIAASRPVPLENVTTFRDIEEEVTDFVRNGFKPGYQIGLQNFDDIFSTYTGQFITVTGIPSSGKSDFVDQMVVGYNKNYGWKAQSYTVQVPQEVKQAKNMTPNKRKTKSRNR